MLKNLMKKILYLVVSSDHNKFLGHIACKFICAYFKHVLHQQINDCDECLSRAIHDHVLN
jgi:hypothetical protein